MVVDERVVKVDVVRYEYLVLQQRVDMLCYFVERRRARYHIRRNASELLNEERDGAMGIDERFPGMQNLLAIRNDDGNFRYARACGIASGGFNIYNSVQH